MHSDGILRLTHGIISLQDVAHRLLEVCECQLIIEDLVEIQIAHLNVCLLGIERGRNIGLTELVTQCSKP